MLSKKSRVGVAKNFAKGLLACKLGNEAVNGNNTYAYAEAASTTNNLSGLAHDERSSRFSTPQKLERTYCTVRTKHGILGGRPVGEDGPHFEPFAIKNEPFAVNNILVPQEDADKYLPQESVSLANTVSTAEKKQSPTLLRTDIPESLEAQMLEYAESEQQIAALSADIDRLNREIKLIKYENSTKDELKEELEWKTEDLKFWRRQQETMLRTSLAKHGVQLC